MSRGKREQASRGTHPLERGGQAASAGAKESKQAEALTNWREEDRQHQQEQKRASKQRHEQGSKGAQGLTQIYGNGLRQFFTISFASGPKWGNVLYWEKITYYLSPP